MTAFLIWKEWDSFGWATQEYTTELKATTSESSAQVPATRIAAICHNFAFVQYVNGCPESASEPPSLPPRNVFLALGERVSNNRCLRTPHKGKNTKPEAVNGWLGVWWTWTLPSPPDVETFLFGFGQGLKDRSHTNEGRLLSYHIKSANSVWFVWRGWMLKLCQKKRLQGVLVKENVSTPSPPEVNIMESIWASVLLPLEADQSSKNTGFISKSFVCTQKNSTKNALHVDTSTKERSYVWFSSLFPAGKFCPDQLPKSKNIFLSTSSGQQTWINMGVYPAT